VASVVLGPDCIFRSFSAVVVGVESTSGTR